MPSGPDSKKVKLESISHAIDVGYGIGKALLTHAESLARASAAKGMAMIVASENRVARRLYENVGYREMASRPIVAFSGLHHGGDWLLMTKA